MATQREQIAEILRRLTKLEQNTNTKPPAVQIIEMFNEAGYECSEWVKERIKNKEPLDLREYLVSIGLEEVAWDMDIVLTITRKYQQKIEEQGT